jgi:hypothetical protein
MTLAQGTDRLASARLLLRRITPDDRSFFTCLHALPKVAQHLYPGGRTRLPQEVAAWLQYTLASYERLARLSRGPSQGRWSADRALRLDGPRCGIDGTEARDPQRVVRARKVHPLGSR